MDNFINSIARIVKPGNNKTAGTGFLVSSNGFLLTCTHVITRDARVLTVVDIIFVRDRTAERRKATVVSYKNTSEGDYALLKIDTVPAGIIPLTFAKFTENIESFITYGFPSVATQAGLSAKGTIEPFTVPSQFSFDVLQLNCNNITEGFSGGPVIDLDSKQVVGIICLITPKDDNGRLINIAFAIPAEEISKNYPQIQLAEIPSVTTGQLKLQQSIVEKIKKISGVIKINILVAASTPADGFDVNNDKAVVQDYINKIFIQSIYRDKFEVTLYSLVDFNKAEILSGSNSGDIGKIISPLPDASDIDLIIWIIWHNMGYLADNTETMEAESNHFSKAKFLVYKRSEKLVSELQLDDSVNDLISNYRQTNDFFNKRAFLEVKEYEKETFEFQFEVDFRRFLYLLLLKQHNDSGDKIAAIKSIITNPFKGLHVYSENDAYLFVGRIRQVDDLIYKIKEMSPKGILIILGASGSGKSSLIRAGLFYRLLSLDAIPGSKKWKIIEVAISQIEPEYFKKEVIDPIINAMGNISGKEKADIRGKIIGQDDMDEIAARLLKSNTTNGKIILFVDQFEELFTLVKSETDRKVFIDLLVKIAKSEKFILLLAMRSDYYHKCSEYPDFQKTLQDRTYTVLQPDDLSLQRIITYPVHASGLKFENEALPQKILNDINKSAGILPLLSYAMFQLVEKRNSQNTLTGAAYAELGGIEGIVERQAEMAMAPFREKDNYKKNFSFLFRKLITISENDEPTKKIAEFEEEKWDEGAVEILQAMIENRLLYIDENTKGKKIIAITHEALLNNWSTLRDWISIARSDLLLLKRVEINAAEWLRAREKATDELSVLKTDHLHLWEDERLQEVMEAITRLDFDIYTDIAPENREAVIKFIRPEQDRLVDELDIPEIGHQRRAEIGDRLAELGDKRKGTGLTADKLPDIIWCRVKPAGIYLNSVNGNALKLITEPFYIAKYPITLLQFNCFTNDDSYNDAIYWNGLDVSDEDKRKYNQTGNLNRPAYFVSWFQAIAFCRWLTQAYQKKELFSAADLITLPAEWEWLAAACGGKNNYNYPWGENWNPDLASNSDGIRQLVAVGLYPNGKSPVGAMDMSGNVYEWCLNEYDKIENTDLSGSRARTTKGGAYFAFKASGEANVALNIHSRLKDNPNGINEVGARIAASIRPICAQPPKGGAVEDLNS